MQLYLIISSFIGILERVWLDFKTLKLTFIQKQFAVTAFVYQPKMLSNQVSEQTR